MTTKGRIGSSFDEFLRDDGIYEDVTARAIKRIIAAQLDAIMAEEGLIKSELAKRMRTSLAQLDRVLDPGNDSSDDRHPYARRPRSWAQAQDGIDVDRRCAMVMSR